MTIPSSPPPPPFPAAPGSVLYLSYGSNLDPNVLSGRRKIKPLESKPVIVPGYWLSFDIGGFLFVEPCFASILKMDPARMHQRSYAQFVHDRTKYGQEFTWDEDHPERSYPPVLQGVVHRISEYDWQKVIQSEVRKGMETNCYLFFILTYLFLYLSHREVGAMMYRQDTTQLM